MIYSYVNTEKETKVEETVSVESEVLFSAE